LLVKKSGFVEELKGGINSEGVWEIIADGFGVNHRLFEVVEDLTGGYVTEKW